MLKGAPAFLSAAPAATAFGSFARSAEPTACTCVLLSGIHRLHMCACMCSQVYVHVLPVCKAVSTAATMPACVAQRYSHRFIEKNHLPATVKFHVKCIVYVALFVVHSGIPTARRGVSLIAVSLPLVVSFTAVSYRWYPYRSTHSGIPTVLCLIHSGRL